MKILKAIMLGLLVTVCAVAGTVAVLHFTGIDLFKGNDEATRIERSNRGDNTDNADEDIHIIPFGNTDRRENEEDFRFWQRTAIKPEGSDYWHYFPIIPYTAQPGEKVVLSVSNIGFKGWSADPNHTLVDLFDETIDDENAYVSFIMPETGVSIAALYDEIPDINYENQREEVMYMMSMHEHGNAPGDRPLRPEQNEDVVVPTATVGNTYGVRLNDPDLLNPDWDLYWDFIFPSPVLDWMQWRHTPHAAGRGGILSTKGLETVPEPPDSGPFRFVVNIYRIEGGTFSGDDWVGGTRTFVDTYAFLVHIRHPDDPPGILTNDVPDAMVDVNYFVPISTIGIPANAPGQPSVWVWRLRQDTAGNGGFLPEGLELWNDMIDYSRGGIRTALNFDGPTAASLLDGYDDTWDPDGPNYSFRINIDPSTATREYYTTFTDLTTENLYITVWPRPVVTPPEFADGMVGQLYNPTFPATLTTDSFDVTNAAALLTKYPTQWTWTQSGDVLPEGLDVVLLSATDPSRVAVRGTPPASAEGETYNITLLFHSANRNLIIGEAIPVPLSIHIWPRPVFKDWDSYNGILPEGMVGPGDPPLTGINKDDKPPDPYPASSTVTWSVPPGSEPDEIYSPAVGTIKPYEGALIEVDLKGLTGVPVVGGVQQISWHGAPVPSLPPLPLPDLPDDELSYSDIVGSSLTIKGKTTNLTEPKDHKLTIGFTISHPNPNIRGASTVEDFTMRIWRRAYLSVIMQHPDIEDWTLPGAVYRSGTLVTREYARAVMPGQWGSIQSLQTGSNFIRWEVDTPDRTYRERLYPGAPLTDWPGIGDNWELTPPGATGLGWVHLRMPLPDSPTAEPVDVVIKGWHSPAPLVIGNSPSGNGNLPPGEFDKNYTGQFMVSNFSPAVLGSGPLPSEIWSLANLPGDTFPPGINVIPNSGSLWGPPTGTQAETFNLHISLTLKGTMKLTYGFHPLGQGLIRGDSTVSTPYSIFIDVFTPNHGDFNGDGKLDLTDLVILSKWVNGTEVEKANAEAAMRQREGWRNSITPKSSPTSFPDGTDLQHLARWFAIDQAYTVWKNSD